MRARLRFRRGMTLVELMTVIAIIVIVMAVAVPAMRPALRSRKVRESTRVVAAYFYGAKARAVEKGRPVGVWIERLDNQTRIGNLQSLQMYIAETPPLYQGDIEGSVGFVVLNTSASRFEVAFTNSATLDRLVQPQETFTVKFGDRGYSYQCARLPGPPGPGATYVIDLQPFGNLIPAGLAPSPGDDGGWGFVGVDDNGDMTADDFGEWRTFGSDDSGGLSFTITLSPRRSSQKPLQLPRATCIDLSVSGMTPTGIEFNPERPGIPPAQAALERNAPVVIMFNPGGDIERIYIGWIGRRPLGSVHLLVGRVEQVNPLNVFAVGDDFSANLMDGENSWVSLGHRSGAVTSAENGPNTVTNTAPQRLFESREYARSAIDRGSR